MPRIYTITFLDNKDSPEKEKAVTLSIRVSLDVRELLSVLSDLECRSVSYLVRELLMCSYVQDKIAELRIKFFLKRYNESLFTYKKSKKLKNPFSKIFAYLGVS